MPLSIRLDQELQQLLSEGARRTRYYKRELLRRTLRLHLRDVIEREAVVVSHVRITNLEPWSHGSLAKAFRRTEKSWEAVEAAAAAAHGLLPWDD